MKTEVSILHNDYPSRIRDVVDEKLQRLVKYCGWTISMHALCERQNDDHRVEIVANAGGGTVLVADARAGAFSFALDEAVDRMTRHLKKHHDKLTRNRHRQGRKAR